MVKYFYIIFIIFLVLGFSSQAYSATLAEASTGKHKPLVGKYDISDMTEEEQEWFTTFLKGNFFADGWEQIASDILKNTVYQEREQQRVRLDKLGYKIGREWSKRNDSRRIHTSELKKWGRELKDTADEAPHLLTEVIQRIDKEVEALIN